MEIKINDVIGIAKEAGKEILRIYETDFRIGYKKDESYKSGVSLLTEADEVANELIVKKLGELYPDIPILSEEGGEIHYEERKNWRMLWLVDPLDGTKEFVKRTGEFTVNIALIRDGIPILGVIYIPIPDVCYYGDENGAFREENGEITKLPSVEKSKDKLIVVSTKSHFNESIASFIHELNENYEVIYVGSSIKLCHIAEGKGHIYPRLGPTKEWDTAAGHAIMKAVGKRIYNFETGHELTYNKENLLNPWFVAE